MRRFALLQCLDSARGYHRIAWARTGVELLVEHVWQHRSRLLAAQQSAIEEAMAWVRKCRAERKGAGVSARDANRDSTAFERARAEWGKATVSARGKVGGGGDGKSSNWLG